MKLFVLGNINSGKSYIINKFQKNLPSYKVLKIDEYRKETCDGSLEAEMKMWLSFPEEVVKYDDVIVELSGGGKVAENILKELEENSFVVLKVNADLETCLKRNEIKDFSKTPYPKEFSTPIDAVIRKIDTDMNNGSIERLWNKAIKIFDVESNCDISKLPLQHYHQLFKLKHALTSFKGSLFTFGSTARGEMKISSDVDLFFLTTVEKAEILKKLKEQFTDVRLMGNEFVIRENGVLLEMNYINDIQDAYYFYSTGSIEKPTKTILKDDFKIIDDLKIAAKKQPDLKKEIEFIIERLNYYIESLKSIIVKGDEYKFYFHNNIIVHEYVKLKAFINGVTERLYLPLMVKEYLTKDEWKDILYFFGKDQITHYNIVRKMGDDIIYVVEKILKDKYK